MDRLLLCALPVSLLSTASIAPQAISQTFDPLPQGLTGAPVAVGSGCAADDIHDLLIASLGTGSGIVFVVSRAISTVRQVTNPGTTAFADRVMVDAPALDRDGRSNIVVVAESATSSRPD